MRAHQGRACGREEIELRMREAPIALMRAVGASSPSP